MLYYFGYTLKKFEIAKVVKNTILSSQSSNKKPQSIPSTDIDAIVAIDAIDAIKKRGSRCFTSDSLLGGGYLRLPASLTIAVVTLRALFQEREVAGCPRGDR